MCCHSPQTRLQLPRTLGLRWIGKSVFRFNLKSGFRILQSNAKSENGFYLREIRPQGVFQLRNPNPDFMDFRFTILLGNPQKIRKTVVVNSGLFCYLRVREQDRCS